MAYSNQTSHYGLPLPTGSDKSTWTDTNNSFTNVDSALYTADQRALAAQTTANAALSEAQSAVTTAGNAQSAAETAQTTANAANLGVEALQRVVTSVQSSLSELSTDFRAELNNQAGEIGSLSELTTTDKTSLVTALNEVNAKPAGGGGEWTLAWTNPNGINDEAFTEQKVSFSHPCKEIYISIIPIWQSGHTYQHIIPINEYETYAMTTVRIVETNTYTIQLLNRNAVLEVNENNEITSVAFSSGVVAQVSNGVFERSVNEHVMRPTEIWVK